MLTQILKLNGLMTYQTSKKSRFKIPALSFLTEEIVTTPSPQHDFLLLYSLKNFKQIKKRCNHLLIGNYCNLKSKKSLVLDLNKNCFFLLDFSDDYSGQAKVKKIILEFFEEKFFNKIGEENECFEFEIFFENFVKDEKEFYNVNTFSQLFYHRDSNCLFSVNSLGSISVIKFSEDFQKSYMKILPLGKKKSSKISPFFSNFISLKILQIDQNQNLIYIEENDLSVSVAKIFRDSCKKNFNFVKILENKNLEKNGLERDNIIYGFDHKHHHMIQLLDLGKKYSINFFKKISKSQIKLLFTYTTESLSKLLKDTMEMSTYHRYTPKQLEMSKGEMYLIFERFNGIFHLNLTTKQYSLIGRGKSSDRLRSYTGIAKNQKTQELYFSDDRGYIFKLEKNNYN